MFSITAQTETDPTPSRQNPGEGGSSKLVLDFLPPAIRPPRDEGLYVFRNPFEVTTTLALALGAGAILLPGGDATVAAEPAPSAPAYAAVSYATDVVPILEKYCYRCHGGMDDGEIRIELSFNMTTYDGLMVGSEYGEVITPGDPDDSLLIEMIEDGDMPDEGDPVPPEQLTVLRTWIAEGANNN